MRFYILFSVLFASLSVSAESLVDLKVGDIKLKVNAVDYQEIESALKQVNKSLASCSPAHVVYTDVLIGRKNSYVIKDSGAYCNVILIKDMSWVYDCKFKVDDTKLLISSIESRLSGRELLGDFTTQEQTLFFNQKKCAVEEL